MTPERLLAHYDRIADAPDAVARLRRFVLDLAVRGKLVAQEPGGECASDLLGKIAKQQAQLVRAGEIKAPKPSTPIGDETPFALPKVWMWVRLGQITSYIQRGKSPVYANSEGALVVSQKCVQWGGLDLTAAKQVTLASLADYEANRFLRDDDLLWNSTGTGTIGRVIRLVGTPPNLVCDSHVTVVRCLGVDPEYVRTWLRSDHVYGSIEHRASGSTNQVELTAQIAINQLVPLPPLAEQHRIVAKVDELMALCDRLEARRVAREAARDRLAAASLARLNMPDPDRATFTDDARFALNTLPALTTRPDQIKSLRQTILNLAVRGKLVLQDPGDEPAPELQKQIAAERARLEKAGVVRRPKPAATVADEERWFSTPSNWAWTRLVEIGQTRTGTSPSSSVPELFGDHIPFIKPADLDGNSISYDGPGLSSEGMSHSRIAPANSVMMVCIGATLGKANVNDRQVCFNQQINSVTPFLENMHKFLLLVLKSPDFQALAWAHAGTGTLPIISKGKWEVLPIPLPPLAEQHRIAAKVDTLMALCDQLQAALATGDDTRRRLLDALLTEALAPIEAHVVAAA